MALSEPVTRQNLQEFLKRAHKLREQKDFAGAFEIAKQCLDAFSQVANVQLLWALVLLDQKKYIDAQKAIHTAIAIDPSNSDFYYILGKIQKAEQHTEEAENAFLQCVKLNNQHVSAYFNLGSIFEKKKRFVEAISMFSKVIELDPSQAKAYYNLGVIYHVQNKLDDAIANYEKAIELMPDDLALLSNLGAALTMDRQHLKAISYYERALALSPDYVPAITNLGGTYIELNELKKAESLLRRSLALNPKLPTNWRNLTLCCHYELLNDPDLVKILELIEEDIKPEDKIHYDFALGKIYHDCQDYKTAYAYYERGNQQQDKNVVFNADAFANHIQQIIRIDKSIPKDRFSFCSQSVQPLFILGTSRSGKSLLETLLKQNPKIAAQGEVGLANRIDAILLADRPQGSYPYWVKNLTQKQANDLREIYLSRLMRDSQSSSEYLIDTMPGNFMYLGLIKELFPQAKFVYCQRSPLDTCTLLYFKYFIQGHAYSYNLKNLAAYYQQHSLLMDYWQNTFSDPIFTVEYEKLVNDPEKTLATLNRSLGFDKHFVFDCSTIHAKEVGIFQYYAKQLEPLEKALADTLHLPEESDTDALRVKSSMSKAYYHFNLGEFEDAMQLCQAILAEEAQHVGALHLLGVIAFKKENYQQASENLQAALAIAPDNLQLHADLAACLQKMGRQTEAMQHLKMIDEKRDNKNRHQSFVLDQAQKAMLINAFAEAPEVIDEFESKLLVSGKALEDQEMASSLMRVTESNFSDLSSGTYHTRMNAWHFLFKHLPVIEQVYKQPKHQIRILDVGCATGHVRRFLEGNFRNSDNKQIFYWGLDSQEAILKRAIRAVDDIESGAQGNHVPSAFIAHDVQLGLPYRNNYFDYIVSFDMIEYLPIPQGRALLAEMYRVLNPQGYLTISTSYNVKQPGFMQSVPFEQFEKILHENGFEIIVRRGAKASFQQLASHFNQAHEPLIKALLSVHPKEMVAAILSPLYPELSEQVTYLCKIR